MGEENIARIVLLVSLGIGLAFLLYFAGIQVRADLLVS